MTTLTVHGTRLRTRLRALRAAAARHRPRGDDGYSTETVLVTALLVALALAVLAIIGAKVLARARSIDLG